MSQPLSRVPEPEIPRPFKRRIQPNGVQQMIEQGWRETRRQGENMWRRGQELWRRGKRYPRTLGLVAGGVAVTLVCAYTVSASGVGRSACSSVRQAGSPSKSGKGGTFRLLMDPIAKPISGGEVEIHYDVCGLPSGAAYKGRVQITQQRVVKKGAPKPKPSVITFQDRVDGPATRRHREIELGKLKPGAYTLELSVTDNRGRERKTLQKIKLTSR
jgi:hypothetical protein